MRGLTHVQSSLAAPVGQVVVRQRGREGALFCIKALLQSTDGA